jgi:hypothetical protein
MINLKDWRVFMKNSDYWIYDWAKFRKDEVVRIPKDYKVNSVFTKHLNKDDIKNVFLELNTLYLNIYDDIAKFPEKFGMPLSEKIKFRHFSQEWRDSGQAPYRPFILLYNLFVCGDMKDNAIYVTMKKYKTIKAPPKYLSGIDHKVKNPQFLFKELTNYGFAFEGLNNNKIADNDIIIDYPDNSSLLFLFKMLAEKAKNTNRLGDFLCCSFRLLQDNMQTINYGHLEDMVDKVHTETEKEFVYRMDKELLSMGLIRNLKGGYEGPGLAYYRNKKIMESKGPYSFRIMSRSPDICNLKNDKMFLELRIRNVSNCMEYLKKCPNSVMKIFTEYSDEGCGKRKENKCIHGVAYEINKKDYWRCACCFPAFKIKPKITDIPHYIKLVELGEKK